MKDLFLFHKKIFDHKILELELLWIKEWSWFTFVLDWNRKQDHAGFHFEIEITGLVFMFNFRDIRHWNKDTNNWQAN